LAGSLTDGLAIMSSSTGASSSAPAPVGEENET
jgi:hypothetical protein